MEEFSLFSSLNSSSFENMIADLFNVKENTNTYTLVGRSGQKQNGIDVYSGAKKTAIQCKFKNDLLPSSSIVSQLKKALKAEIIEAKSSNLDFENYILVSNYRDDVQLQLYANQLKRELNCSFNVNYMGADIFKVWLNQFPNIAKVYFQKLVIPFEPVELVNISVDSEKCAWESRKTKSNYIFYENDSKKSRFPIFDFSFINHLDRTIILKSIRLVVKDLFSGFSGPPSACLLESAHTYRMEFQYNKVNVLETKPPLQIPKEQAFRFKLQTAQVYDNEPTPITGRNIFQFEFEFSSGIIYTAPEVLINTDKKSDKIRVEFLN